MSAARISSGLVDSSVPLARFFFRKVKALTGASPSVFIRSVRLHKAKALLRNSAFTIVEVACEVGFSTPAYFSTTFPEEFGMTPGAWREG